MVAINHQTERAANLKPIAAMAAPTALFALKASSAVGATMVAINHKTEL